MRYLFTLVLLLTASCAQAEPPSDLVPLYRFYNKTTFEHTYAFTDAELSARRSAENFEQQIAIGRISTKSLPGTVRLWHAVRNGANRHFYYTSVGRPRNITVDNDGFVAYVWTEPGDGRIGIYHSTWLDGTDVFLDPDEERVDRYSKNTKKALGVDRLRPRKGPLFYIYPAPATGSAAGPRAVAKADGPGLPPPMKLEQRPARSPSLVAEEGDSTSQAEPLASTEDETVTFSPLELDEAVSSMAMTEDGKHLVLAHRSANSVSVYDVLGKTVVASVSCPAPRSLLCRGDRVFVANDGQGTITVLSQRNDWKSIARLKLSNPNVVYLSAAKGTAFADELIVTCHGPGREASYQDCHTLVVDVRKNRCRDIGKSSLVSVSADGRLAITQQSFNLSPSGGISAFNYSQFTTAGTKRTPLYNGGDQQTPFVYQVLPGGYWLSNEMIFGGTPILKQQGDFGQMIIPDLAQKLIYTVTEHVVRGHRLNTTFTELGMRRVQFKPAPKDYGKFFRHLYRMRDYWLDHPVAFTHEDRLFLFLLSSEGGRVFAAETICFESTPTPSVPADPSALAASTESATTPSPAGPPEPVLPIVSPAPAEPTPPGTSPRAEAPTDMIARCEQSVVRIETTSADGSGIGSGFVVDEKGTMITNCHVLAGATTAKAYFSDGQACDIVGTLAIDQPRDIVVARISLSTRPHLGFAPALPRKGESVVALGAPHGLSFTATRGIVSAIRPKEEMAAEMGDSSLEGTWIQVDAALSPGNSGGPIVNESGLVVAMSSLASRGSAQNLNFGISAPDIAEIVDASWSRPLVSLKEGVSKINTEPSSRDQSSGGMVAGREAVPAEAISAYLDSCRESFRHLVRDFRDEMERLSGTLREMKRGENFIPPQLDDGSDMVRLRDVQQRRVTWYFRSEAVKAREMSRLEDRVRELAKVRSEIKNSDDPASILRVATALGPKLDPRREHSVGFLADALVIHAFNDHEVAILYDDATYMVWVESTVGLALGQELVPQPVYVSGTATVEMRGGATTSVTVLQAVTEGELRNAVDEGKPSGADASPESADGPPQAGGAEKSAMRSDAKGFRTWHDRSGRFAIEAQLIDLKDGKATLKRRDGKVIEVSVKALSDSDREYLSTR